MGAGGRDTDKEAQGEQPPLPPAYQEKEPLPPDNPDPEAPAVGDGHEPPVIVQNHPQCKVTHKGPFFFIVHHFNRVCTI